MKWPTGTLDSIAILDRQSIHPSQAEAATPYLGLEHLDGDGGINRIQTVGSAGLKSNKFQFSDRHVLFGKLRPYLRKIARPEFSGVCSTDIIPILPKDGTSRDYLFYFLRTPDTVSLATSRCSGANLPRLGPRQLASLQIPLPPLAEQRRIAGILDAADALRAKRREALAQLDTLLQSTFLDMFGDPVTNPMGWTKVRSGELFLLPPKIGTITPAAGRGYLVVRVGEVGESRIAFERCGRVEISEKDFAKFRLERGDTVIARAIGSKNHLGKASFFADFDEATVIDSHVMRLRPDPIKCDGLWFYSLISSDRGKSSFSRQVAPPQFSSISTPNRLRLCRSRSRPSTSSATSPPSPNPSNARKPASAPTSPNSTRFSPLCRPAPSGETSEPLWRSPPTSRS